MSGPDASWDEMPGFPFPHRPVTELDESLLDALLTGTSLPPGAPEQARAVADMLASLAEPAGPGLLAGEAAARSAFARAPSPAGISPADRRPARHRPRQRGFRLGTRLAAALTAVTIGLGGAAAAAYAGVLPGPVQELAHEAIGAPAAHRPAVHPPRSQQAMSRLCAAYRRAEIHGPAGLIAGKFTQLTRAAGGAGKVDSYCAAVREAGIGPTASEHGKANAGKAKAHRKVSSRGKAKGRTKARAHAKPSHPAHPAKRASGGPSEPGSRA
jgi:hypothetical protein